MSFRKQLRRKYFYRKCLRPIYQKMYGYRKLEQRKMLFQQNGKDLLLKFTEVMDKIQCPYWLEFGTLLGAVREGNFISHDFDLDIGIYYRDYSEVIHNELQKAGFKLLRRIKSLRYNAMEQTYIYKGVTIDIFLFFFDEEKQLSYCYGFEPLYSKSFIEDFKHIDDFCVEKCYFPPITPMKYSFLGIDVSVPKNYSEHLKMHYGDNYLVPDKKWNDSFSTTTEFLEDQSIKMEQY